MSDDKKIIFSMVGVSKVFPPQKRVLNNIYLSFFYGAKIGIIGLNGSGKSTLLKIIAGVESNYDGNVVFSPGYSVGYLEQEPPLDETKDVKGLIEKTLSPNFFQYLKRRIKKYLKQLCEIGVLEETTKGREKYFINKELWQILTHQ